MRRIAPILKTTLKGVNQLFSGKRGAIEELTTNEYINKYYATYIPEKLIIYPESFQQLAPPLIVDGHVNWKFMHLTGRQVPEAFVMRLERGSVYGGEGAIITKEGILLRDVSREFGNREKHSVFAQIRLPALKNINKKVAVLVTSGANTYYHWMFDLLPRIHLLEKAGLKDEMDYFVLPPIKYSFQRETLQSLGIPEKKWLIAEDKNFYVEATNLFVPSLPSLLGTVNLWVLDFIKERFLPADAIPRTKKIYISRKKTNARKLLNESEIIQYLESFGFETVYPEELSVKEQALLYHSAAVIIAPHGSGLSNIVFCHPGTKIIELSSVDFLVPCYWIMASQLKHNYLLAMAETSITNSYSPYWESKGKDFYFPVETIKKALRTLNINS